MKKQYFQVPHIVLAWCKQNLRNRPARAAADSVQPWRPMDTLEPRTMFSAPVGAMLPVKPVAPTPINGENSAMNQKFVSQVYKDVLSRSADPAGLAAWTSYLDAGHGFGDVATAITSSREYDGDIVDKFYVDYLGRHAEPQGLGAWVDKMQSGLNAQVIRTGILGSDEFYNRPARTPSGATDSDFGGGNGSDRGYITALYNDFLGREPDSTGLSAWQSVLGGKSADRASVATGISNSDENRSAIVTGYYQSYFGRSPDAVGLDYWKGQLAHGVSQPTLITAFVTSPEYLDRHGIITSGNTVPTPTPAPTPSPTPTSGNAPAWNLPDVNGNMVHSKDLAGQVVIVDFWATWCGPCRLEIPQLIALQSKYGAKHLTVVGIAIDEPSAADVKAYMQQSGINYQVVMGDSATMDAFGGVSAIPAAFVIDRSGNISSTFVGYDKNASVLENAVTPLL